MFYPFTQLTVSYAGPLKDYLLSFEVAVKIHTSITAAKVCLAKCMFVPVLNRLAATRLWELQICAGSCKQARCGGFIFEPAKTGTI